MLQRHLIDLDIACLVRQQTVRNDTRRDLGRGHMDHVERARHFARLFAEGRGLCRAVDRDQGGFEIEVDAVPLDIAHQRGDIVLHAEQHAARIVEGNINVVQDAAFQPVVARQVHRLLRGAGAFDGHRRLGEQRNAFPQIAYQLPGIGRCVVAIIGRNAVLAQRCRQPVDRVPVQHVARRDNQRAIANRAAIGCRHLILFGLKALRGFPDPGGTLGHHRRHRMAG